jgi:Asp-tRNA(Asn)/Glu-tRNA(Gln) amidotransferase A subunit family amidase
MADEELCFTSATDLASDIRAGKISPVEVVDAVLRRIERVNGRINAYCTVAAEAARGDARRAEAMVTRGEPLGPLHGVPISFKDLTPTAGIRTTFGSKVYEHHVPDADALIVERARRAGAVVLGKTNTPEFGCKGVTDNLVFGHTRNPWNTGRVAGGSSGGAAAAVAAGLGPLAEGSDLAGSIRIPAALCGVVGLKPSVGRIPTWPAQNGWTSFACVGPLTRTVRDAALFLETLAGPDARDPQSLPATGDSFVRDLERGVKGLRVAWTADLGYATVDPEVRRLTATAARTFEELGCVVEEAHPGFEDALPLFVDLTAPMRAAAAEPHLAEWRDRMDPILVARAEHGQRMSAADWERATYRRTVLWHRVRRFFERHDLLLTPTAAVAAFPIGRTFPETIAGRAQDHPMQWFPFTFPFAITAQPAISVPAGFTSEGLPVGLQIVGPRHADGTVLRAAAAFEAARPWADRRPAIG